MKLSNIIEKMDDLFFKFSPNIIYRWWHNIFNFTSHIHTIKMFFQRLFRGWDDRETWSLDSNFLKWLSPRLKRFTEVNVCYPGTKRYPTYKSWNNELKYRCWQLDKIIEYEWNEWEFPYTEYLMKDENHQTSDDSIKSQAYYRCKQDFMIWYGDVINHLWW